MMKRLTLFALPVMLLCLMACSAGQVQNKDIDIAYKTLDTLAITYETAMESIADLHRQGHVDDATRSRVIEYGNAFHAAYHSAVEALVVAKKGQAGVDVYQALTLAQEHYAAFASYLWPILQQYIVERG